VSDEECLVQKCPCGYTKNHYMVTAENEYKFTDWLWVIMGITTNPKKIRFKCRQCQTVISITTNPKELKKNS